MDFYHSDANVQASLHIRKMIIKAAHLDWLPLQNSQLTEPVTSELKERNSDSPAPPRPGRLASVFTFLIFKQGGCGMINCFAFNHGQPMKTRQLGKILETLSLLKADGSLPLNSWVEKRARQLTRGSIVIVITPSDQPELLYIVDGLHRMGLKPILITVDASTFGKPHGSNDIFQQELHLDIPVYRVAKGDNLTTVLSTGSEFFKDHNSVYLM
jgi:hypothetical protein